MTSIDATLVARRRTEPPPWWQTRAFAIVATLAACLPLLLPAVPPLADLPGHIGRYRIMVEAGQLPLAAHYDFDWAVIGNLGVDTLVFALHPLLDVEPATKLIVLAIPVLTVAAMLWVAREAHGRLPPTAAFALPLAFAWPFQLGFVNFALAVALVFTALAGWLRLARSARPGWLRAALFVPVACLVWLCHSYGWAMLMLFVTGAEWAHRRQHGDPGAIRRAILTAAPLALPQAAALLWKSGAGATGDWFDWPVKLQWLVSPLRERWQVWDVASVALLVCVLWFALRTRRLGFSPLLAAPAVLGFVAFVLLPRFLAGGSFGDMRMLPYALALALLAIRPRYDDPAVDRRIAAVATAFFALRLLTTTVAFWLFAAGQEAALRAIPALPVGAAVLVLIDEPPSGVWAGPRLGHVAGLAIARRRVFTNEQWILAGQQLIAPRHTGAAPFDRDPSQLVYRGYHPYAATGFDAAIRNFDRATFSHVWTIGFPAGRAKAHDLHSIRSDDVSTVYRVESGFAADAAPLDPSHPARAPLS